MKIKYGFILGFSFLIINCNWIKSRSQDDKLKIENIYKFTASIPNLDTQGKLESIRDSFFVSSFNSSIIFAIPTYLMTEFSDRVDRKAIFSFFTYNKTEKIGKYYFSLKDSTGIIMQVDSFMKQHVFGSINLYDIIHESILLNNDSTNDIIVKKYLSKLVIDESFNDTTVLYFTKEKRSIDLPFCKKLDSSLNLSLTRARFIFNERFLPKYAITLPLREMQFEVIEEKREILELSSFIRTRLTGQ